MSAETHPTDRLLDLLDGRLAGEDRVAVDAHLRDCASCRGALAELTAVRRAVARLDAVELPAGLQGRILDAIDADRLAQARSPEPAVMTLPPEDAPTAPRTTAGWPTWAALGGLAAVLALAVALWRGPATDLPGAAAAHVAAYEQRRLALERPAPTAEALQRDLQARVSFPVRVFDLAMMGFTITRGGVVDLDGRPAAAWIYQSTAGTLICEMFLGSLRDLPAPDETRDANGFTFYIYRREGGTQVFWEEGDVVCVLASHLPSEDVLQLAVAKAMKP